MRTQTQAWLLLSGLTAAAVFLLAGCPGPDSSGNSNDNSIGSANGANANGGAPVSVEQRSAVFGAVDAVLASQSPDDLPAASKAVAEMLRADAAIAKVGVNEDGSVWAIFADGRPPVVALNRPVSEDIAKAAQAAGVPKPLAPTARPAAPQSHLLPKPADRAQVGAPLASIPHGRKAFLFNTIGPSLEVDGHLQLLEQWLEEGGYTVDQSTFRGTIDDLRQVKDAAVVYINGHGGHGYIPAPNPNDPDIPVYAIGTVTIRARDGSTDAAFQADLDSGAVGYIKTPTLVVLPQLGQRFGQEAYDHYFVTQNFIRDNWQFVGGGQAYFDTCSAAATDEIAFACFGRGCGVFFGWNSIVRLSDTYESSQYYLSRTLGAVNNYAGASVAREEPPQRPFSTDTIFGSMPNIRRNNPHDLPGFAPTMLDESFRLLNAVKGQGVTSRLTMTTSGTSRTPLLRASVSSLTVSDEEGWLSVGGNFGWDWESAVVTVGGQALPIIEGGPGYLKCELPDDAAGPVEVTLFEKTSNVRNLTLWTGTASVESAAPEGSTSVALDVKIRGDLQNYRLFPGEIPRQWAGGFSGTCIPNRSRISGHGVDLTFPCNLPDRSDDRHTLNFPGAYPGYRPQHVGGPGFFFGRGAEPPVADEAGTWAGTFFWVATIEDGVSQQINCVQEPRTQIGRFDSPAGGVLISLPVGNYTINETESFEIDSFSGPITITSHLNLTPSFEPTLSDPR